MHSCVYDEVRMHDDYSHACRVRGARFVRGKRLLLSKTDTDVRERHACAHFMGVAQSRPDRGPIEAQCGPIRGPL